MGEPIDRSPIIAGRSAKDRARLKTNHCFAAAPDPSSVVSVAGGNVQIGAVTGDAANSPYTAAHGAGGPCRYAGWIIDRHAQDPAIIDVAIIHASICDIKNVTQDGQRRSLRLSRWSEGRAVVLGGHLHVHRPAGIDGARVYIKGNDVMLYGRAAIGRNHCVQKKRPRSKIDNRRADNAHGTGYGAGEIGFGHRIA